MFSFAAKEGENKEYFAKRSEDEFKQAMEDNDLEMVPTGIIIPEVPEMADDDTEEARDELLQLDKDLSYC